MWGEVNIPANADFLRNPGELLCKIASGLPNAHCAAPDHILRGKFTQVRMWFKRSMTMESEGPVGRRYKERADQMHHRIPSEPKPVPLRPSPIGDGCAAAVGGPKTSGEAVGWGGEGGVCQGGGKRKAEVVFLVTVTR